ncbi:hypothetical protein CSAL01_07962 [Colletotrichum salicis]|uniref:AB hydrolase-1 domain-containing protein n=1 Tax=Colletotrichum salicis TaxID=1209931 RepID=A0A135V2S1_9PEZI|nr:hypothetical protein CSAL01_07962 [Colletotrichum salicis]
MTVLDLSMLTKKTLAVSRGFTYTYYTSPARNSLPTLLLFHGWPDTARRWAGLANNCLIPPDAVEILDTESLTRVISLGHDWGCLIAQRLYNFHPDRICGLVTLSVPYMPPSGDFDLKAVNEMTRKAFDVGIFEYWHFFLAEDSVDIMNTNLESVYSVTFGDPHTWLENWCTPGKMRQFITRGRTQPTLLFATPEHRADFMERYGRDGGFAAPRCVYTVTSSGISARSERMLSEDVKTVRVPVLYWGGEQDYVCRPELFQQSIAAGVLPDVKSTTSTGGHWAFLERPLVFGEDVMGWLQEIFDSCSSVGRFENRDNPADSFTNSSQCN